jgi:hypothetical protein
MPPSYQRKYRRRPKSSATPREDTACVSESTGSNLYDFFKEKSASLASGTKTGHAVVTTTENNQRGGVICLLNFLRSICNHGEQLLPETALRIWNTRDKSMARISDITMRDINDEPPRYSAKVLALLRNLLVAHTRTNDIIEYYILVKRCERIHTS